MSFRSIFLLLSILLPIACQAAANTHEEPLQTKEIFVPVPQGELFCQVIGKGDPLIIIHGGPGMSQEYLLPNLKQLAKNHLLIFYDQRCCGRSRGEIIPELITTKSFVEDIDSIRKWLALKKSPF